MTRSTRTRRRLDPEVRREQIVEAAESVFAGRDPADVTFEAVADAAGVSRGLVYNYFGDRSGLIAAVYLRSFDRLDAALADVAARHPPAERLPAVVACYLDVARSNPAAWKLIGTAEATVHPAVQRARRARVDSMARNWDGAPEARMLARGVVGFLEAATLEWLEQEDPIPVEGACEALTTMLEAGLSGFPWNGDGQATG